MIWSEFSMLYNKHLAKTVEKQHMRQTRQFYLALAEINLQLSTIHQRLSKKIDLSSYEYVTEYVNQYISYTTIWNLKFVYNLENPEVALLQIFHLRYIFNCEPEHLFKEERAYFEEAKECFAKVNPFKPEKVDTRYNEMLQYIETKKAEKQ
jgi:hypothetical protein